MAANLGIVDPAYMFMQATRNAYKRLVRRGTGASDEPTSNSKNTAATLAQNAAIQAQKAADAAAADKREKKTRSTSGETILNPTVILITAAEIRRGPKAG